MRQFIAENGRTWKPPPEGDAETILVLEAMAEDRISASDFILWVAARLDAEE